nr:ribonuclease H-like domain-containing protein [Tanacetum cinerariifolium]
MYSIDLNNIVPHEDLTCLVAKASIDECMLWHRRLGHLNIKTMNRKQHKASCKTNLVNSVTKPFHTLHMDLSGPTFDETSGILRNFIIEIENLKELRVKISRVLVNKSQNKTPYELFNGRSPAIGFLKPFGCHVMILNTLDNLGKFKAKGDEGYFVGYFMSSKAFRVFNKRTKRVEENLHVDFLENKPIEKGAGLNWLFDIDSLTNSMNYVPVVVTGTNSTNFSGIKEATGQNVKKDVSSLRYIVLPNWFHETHLETSTSNAQDACNADAPESSGNSNPTATLTNPLADHMETLVVKTPILTISSLVLTACLNNSPEPSNILRVTTNTDDTNGVEADQGNMETTITSSPTPTFKIHKDHPKIEPKKISDALQDPSWVEAIQEELLQFKIQNVWSLVDCPKGDPEFPARVCKVEKAMYGLHQAPRAWYAYSDSDYGGATQDRKSTTGGCQFFGRRLISWQCKKQTIVATSITKAEYVAAASGCGQVLWIQNQLLEYGHTVFGWGIGTSKYWGVLRILMISLRLIPL